MLRCVYLPAAGGGVAEEVVDHVHLVYHHEALLAGLLPVHVGGPLDEEAVQVVHPGAPRHKASVYRHGPA